MLNPYCTDLVKMELPQGHFITVPAPVDMSNIEPYALTSSLHL